MLKMLLIISWLAMHPVHVSLMSIEYSTEDKGFKVFIKVYYDDFLTDYATLKGSQAVPDLSKADESSGAQIAEYLKQRIHLFAGDTELTPDLVDFNLSGNEIKINLICRMKRKVNAVTVTNTIMTDIYMDQVNLVILRYGSFEEGIKLSHEKREYRFIVKK